MLQFVSTEHRQFDWVCTHMKCCVLTTPPTCKRLLSCHGLQAAQYSVACYQVTACMSLTLAYVLLLHREDLTSLSAKLKHDDLQAYTGCL